MGYDAVLLIRPAAFVRRLPCCEPFRPRAGGTAATS